MIRLEREFYGGVKVIVRIVGFIVSESGKNEEFWIEVRRDSMYIL